MPRGLGRALTRQDERTVVGGMDPRGSVEARLQRRLRRHGWRLEASPASGEGPTGYRIVDEADGSPVVGDEFALDLQDVALWLE